MKKKIVVVLIPAIKVFHMVFLDTLKPVFYTALKKKTKFLFLTNFSVTP